MFLLAAVVLAGAAPTASAATFRVYGTADVDGGCEGLRCPSLRAALNAARLDDQPDEIRIPAGEHRLQLGQLVIDTPVEIVGAGARDTTIFGGATFRVMEVVAGSSAKLSGVTMADGWANPTPGNPGFRAGGIIRNHGTLTLDRVRVTGGNATSGGGIANTGGMLTIDRSLIDGNDGGSDAGGLLNFAGGTVVVRTSTIARNVATQGGGFMSWGDPGPANTSSFDHVSIVGNHARGAHGGVNHVDSRGDVLRMVRSLIAGNTAPTGAPRNCGRPVTSLNFNVADSDECGLNGDMDRVVADARLGEGLQNLGGETDVWPLLADSPAVDWIQGCSPDTDQRGIERPQGDACEVGAYEHDPVRFVFGPRTHENDPGPTTFAFTGPEGATFQCELVPLEDTNSNPCPSPKTYEADLQEGTYTFNVRGLVDGRLVGVARRTFTVDITRPSAPIIESPKEGSTVRRVVLTGTTEPFATAEIRESGGDDVRAVAADDTGYWRLDMGVVPPGRHTYLAFARDRAGNESETSSQVTVQVSDAEPPVAVITAPTATVFQNRNPRFEFTGGATYECRLLAPEFAPCESGVTYGPLDDGDYRFEVRAIAADGLPQDGATPFLFTVDNRAPDPPTIDSPMDGSVIAQRTVMLRGQTEDFTEVDVYDGATRLGRAMIENEGTGDWKFEPMEPLAPGNHTFTAETIDDAGNVSGRSTPVRVHVATVTITSPKPAAVSGSVQQIAFAASMPDGLTYECRHVFPDGSDEVESCESPWVRRDLIEGSHTMSVVAVDAGGPGDETLGDSWTFTVDQTGPETTIDSGPSGATRETSAMFTFGSAEPEATFRCRHVPPSGEAEEGACASPLELNDLAEGTHRFEVVAEDALGNPDATPATRTWTVDTRAPQPGVSATAVGDAATMSFAAEPGTTYTCALAGPGQDGAFRPCASPQSYSGLQPGDYRFTLRAVDAAGNVSESQRTFSITQVLPAQTPTPTPTRPPAPRPEFGETVVVRPVSGRIRVKRPGSNEFVELGSADDIPFGSEVDTKRGRIQLTAIPIEGKPAQRAVFYAGIFVIRQRGTVIDLVLSEELAPCPRARRSAEASQTRKPKKRKLWGDGRGRFRTTGRYSAATVRGTKWLVEDRCAGTRTTVRQGVVAVRDRVRKRTVLVRQGRSYLARARR
jgi:hypothetical protein